MPRKVLSLVRIENLELCFLATPSLQEDLRGHHRQAVMVMARGIRYFKDSKPARHRRLRELLAALRARE